MILTVAELCDKAARYLQSISVGNKGYTYIPPDALKKGGEIKSYSFLVECPDECRYYEEVTRLDIPEEDCIKLGLTKGKNNVRKYPSEGKKRTIQMYIKTNEDIPKEYIKPVSNDDIVKTWKDYAEQYIYTKLDGTTFVSITSLFTFLYLFRYFVDTHFCQFSDIYTKTSVWLYKTGVAEYNPTNMVISSENLMDKTMMDAYISTLVTEIVSRDTHKVLGAAASTNSCSSSSSSSSCSSSSCSSSCSSSSSSSSSLFIAYFNLG